jgi:hypothetical protein
MNKELSFLRRNTRIRCFTYTPKLFLIRVSHGSPSIRAGFWSSALALSNAFRDGVRIFASGQFSAVSALAGVLLYFVPRVSDTVYYSLRRSVVSRSGSLLHYQYLYDSKSPVWRLWVLHILFLSIVHGVKVSVCILGDKGEEEGFSITGV